MSLNYLKQSLFVCSSFIALETFIQSPLHASTTTKGATVALKDDTEALLQGEASKKYFQLATYKALKAIGVENHNIVEIQQKDQKEVHLMNLATNQYDVLWRIIFGAQEALYKDSKLNQFDNNIALLFADMTKLLALHNDVLKGNIPEKVSAPNLSKLRVTGLNDTKEVSAFELRKSILNELNENIKNKRQQLCMKIQSVDMANTFLNASNNTSNRIQETAHNVMKEQSLNLMIVLTCQDAILDKLVKDTNEIVQQSRSIIELIQAYQGNEAKKNQASNTTDETRDYEDMLKTNRDEIINKINTRKNTQNQIRQSILNLAEILRRPGKVESTIDSSKDKPNLKKEIYNSEKKNKEIQTSFLGDVTSHSLGGFVSSLWDFVGIKHHRQTSMEEIVHPLITFDHVMSAFYDFHTTVIEGDTELERIIFSNNFRKEKREITIPTLFNKFNLESLYEFKEKNASELALDALAEKIPLIRKSLEATALESEDIGRRIDNIHDVLKFRKEAMRILRLLEVVQKEKEETLTKSDEGGSLSSKKKS